MTDLLTHSQAPNTPAFFSSAAWASIASALNSGTIEFDYTFGVAISNSHYASFARALINASDSGGLWLEFGDLKLYNQSGDVFSRSMSGTTAGAVARFKIALAPGTNASSVTITQVSGTVGGTGTQTFTTSGTYYTTTNTLGIGGFNGNDQWDTEGQIGTITDGAGAAYTLTADAGALALTGTAAGLRAARKIVALAGSLALTGTAAGLVGPSTYTLQADPGALTLTGTDATLSRTRKLVAAAGNLALTGTDATLTKSGGLEFGVHDISFQLFGNGSNPNSVTLDTTDGSTFLVMMGGLTGDIDNGPTDNKGNTYTLVDSVRAYSAPNGAWGTAVWICRNATGGTSHTFSQFVTDEDESTMFVLELLGASRVQSVAWSQTSNPGSGTNASDAVTTTDDALLVATWWGAAPTGQDHTAVPDSGFTVIESYLTDHINGYIQAALATRAASTPGSYSTTWTNTPNQGAQMWVIALQAPLSLTADAGNLALTGTAATLQSTRSPLVADPGVLALTGTAAGLRVARRLGADAGSHALTGTAAGLRVARELAADPGALALTGTAATLRRGRVLAADPGALALAGQAAGLRAARKLTAEAGGIPLTGTAADLRRGRVLVADAGSLPLAGVAAGFVLDRSLVAAAGNLALTGVDATLTVDTPGSYTLVAESGNLALTGASATLLYSGAVPSGPRLLYACVWLEAVKVYWEATMSDERTVRQGDTPKTVRARAFSSSEAPDLSGYTSLTFRMTLGELEIEGAASGDADGFLSYTFTGTQLDVAGTYEATFRGVDESGEPTTFPESTNLRLIVVAS